MAKPSLKSFIIAVAIGLVAQHTLACDFPAPSITAYAKANPGYVVFVGTVTSTTPFWKRWFGAPEASVFEVSAWHAGRTRLKFVTVLHTPVPDPTLYYCGPPRGFSARKGEQLLIVGKPVGAFIEPESPFISPVGSTKLPVEFARELDDFRRGTHRY